MNQETLLAVAEELRLRQAWEEILYAETETQAMRLAA